MGGLYGLMAVVTSVSGNHTRCELGGAGSGPSPCICSHSARLWLRPHSLATVLPLHAKLTATGDQ